MENKKKIEVFIRFAHPDIPVGQLVQDGKAVLFRYNPDYLLKGWNISPKKIRFDEAIQSASYSPFEGLFGVFADSLPDAWGNLLLRKWLATKKLHPAQLNSLDRLSLVGENGPGALIYKPVEEEQGSTNEVDLDFLNQQVAEVISGESEKIIDELFQKAGSPGGARPKIYTGFNNETNELIYGRDQLPDGFSHWMVKFAATTDSLDIANSEMAYYQMATTAGIPMSESRLLSGKSGKVYFATKRFDRESNRRLHLISAAGMFHDDYEHSQLDYGTLIHETIQLINDYRAAEDQFRRAVFNVFAHNRDDHSKNFGFLMNEQGTWSVAPAFDLTFSSSSQGMHSTTVARNGMNPGTKELMSLAEHFSIRNGEKIIQEVKSVIREWEYFANQAGVQKNTRKAISTKLKEINQL